MSCINKNIPNRSPKECKKRNYIQNKDEILQKQKEYYTHNKDEILQKRKEYVNKHKDEISTKNKEYRNIHKDEIAKRKQMKCICICGSEFCLAVKARHERSIKHQTYLKNQASRVDTTSTPDTL